MLNRQSELILVFENDYPISRQFRSATFKRGTLNDIWQIDRNRNNKKKEKEKSHGATFPETLISKIVENFSKKGHKIYDPFLGTGTTAVVAKKLKRKYIGSEILNDYCNIHIRSNIKKYGSPN